MTNRKPNIVFMLSDHQAYYRHGWDGGFQVSRPNYQRLANEGVHFDRAYTSSPLCTPARRSLMTGLYPHNHGFVTLDESENTEERDFGFLYGKLAEQGYRLYYYGKWHAGPGTAHDFGCEGFCYPGYGNPYLTPEYQAYLEAKGLEQPSINVEHVFMEPVSPDEPSPGPGYRCEAPNLHPHVTGVFETPPETHESFFLVNLASEKLRELAENDDGTPFFLRVDFYGPHPPYAVNQEYLDLYPPESIPEYGSFRDDMAHKPPVYLRETNDPFAPEGRLIIPSVLEWSEWQRILRYVYAHDTQVDAAVGIILDQLDRLGLAENTLVVWTTDHGDPIASHGGRFGKEAYLSEEVLRIPLVMRWPSKIEAGQSSNHLVSLNDLPGTLLEAAGTTFNGPVDGKSLLTIFKDGQLIQGNERWREDLMCETHGHHGEPVIGRALVTEQFRYAVYRYLDDPGYLQPGDPVDNMSELYDLEKDPFQIKNLAYQSEYRATVVDLKTRLKLWCERSGDSIGFDLAEA
jgi:arylsulfatase A-like enzyme